MRNFSDLCTNQTKGMRNNYSKKNQKESRGGKRIGKSLEKKVTKFSNKSESNRGGADNSKSFSKPGDRKSFSKPGEKKAYFKPKTGAKKTAAAGSSSEGMRLKPFYC